MSLCFRTFQVLAVAVKLLISLRMQTNLESFSLSPFLAPPYSTACAWNTEALNVWITTAKADDATLTHLIARNAIIYTLKIAFSLSHSILHICAKQKTKKTEKNIIKRCHIIFYEKSIRFNASIRSAATTSAANYWSVVLFASLMAYLLLLLLRNVNKWNKWKNKRYLTAILKCSYFHLKNST